MASLHRGRQHYQIAGTPSRKIDFLMCYLNRFKRQC
ncbi:MAG: hypothetical protein Satyrvirus23_10 [Satyrvirus sp.]|uniref:Uncharacterized protein n=1 Tax=Satyrvirus sp. TaxID=2487771 RepID=A0A3G5AEH0_9VIRU|nr:MAG: hypothetical protein Satyrvirus23_10 [Satyrvirus sp.]